MFKKTLTTQALALLLLGGGMAFTTASCNRADRQEAAADTDAAYSDFKTFVANTEASAQNVGNKTQAEWDQETTQLKADYDAKVAAAEANMSSWDDARKAEYEQLKTRYTTAYDAREAAYRSSASSGGMDASGAPAKLGKYYKPAATTPSQALTAANARQTYEDFVKMVKQNEDRYDIDDWRNVNAEWRALDEAYDRVKGDIPANDLAEIQKEKLKYAAFKSFDKSEARVAEGADAVERGTANAEAGTRDERAEVKSAASNTAADVKDAGKSVGQKIGNAAKKVGEKTKEGYKEVKSEVKNTDND
ncbi:hypothetical protein F0P96_02170 [Hymenobacter busanensis]|uniref:Uncharacterized protein n=1 Tax=Hymenobacter busanensis TaxID=2607656 RepID=A0A7L4ZTR8_9BACT|nr:hypothetical protein [Hymenobacter busanensis]KAA9339448.1 hypothetical protein F0P96_02170 [Hymenobacter busanensis]QHJ06794.1 hypothetical protein GUY19_05580 [Hymenobacter busanensis]